MALTLIPEKIYEKYFVFCENDTSHSQNLAQQMC